jgi:hypothetical protein
MRKRGRQKSFLGNKSLFFRDVCASIYLLFLGTSRCKPLHLEPGKPLHLKPGKSSCGLAPENQHLWISG